MKLKYKKIILTITTFTMMIGMVIFSIISPGGSSASEAGKLNNSEEEMLTENNDSQMNEDASGSEETQVAADGQEIVLEKSADSALNQLLVDYFNASVSCDMDELGHLVSDVSVLNEDELKVKYELVEAVENVECYVVKGPSEGKYLVYVYSEIKFKDIKTKAPGLSRLTVVNAADGGYVIFFGADAEIEQFAKITDSSEPVQEMVKKVSRKMKKAMNKDADLKALNEKMTGDEQEE